MDCCSKENRKDLYVHPKSKMDNLNGSEKNVKNMDSAYSNSCSNSQSRRSHSSKSTRSWSNNSTSSGYGGKQSTSGSSDMPVAQGSRNKDKVAKKKKQVQPETLISEEKSEAIRSPEPVPKFNPPQEEPHDVVQVPSPVHSQTEKVSESMEISTHDRNRSNDENGVCGSVRSEASANIVAVRPTSSLSCEGFSCVISMHDGVVMYTTSTLTASLGFPKDMWIGRSFIDFVHPSDRHTFASQITKGLAAPKYNNDLPGKAQLNGNSISTLFCRIRRYRGLSNGFGVKGRMVTHMPFLIKLSFKNVSDEEGKDIFLVIQATPLSSAFRLPNEVLTKDVSFVIRHVADGNMEYIDPEAVPYLGYLPQDVIEKDTLRLYHPDDLTYLKQVYETIVKEGSVVRCKPYRRRTSSLTMINVNSESQTLARPQPWMEILNGFSERVGKTWRDRMGWERALGYLTHYRNTMRTQNGDYLKLDTEWSSFINPWSRKLEFVIGKHHVIEGPANPDVFQAPEVDKVSKLSEEEKTKIQLEKDDILRILNEELTKPAEVVKQQMSKRCQDLAAFMENLWEDTLKIDDELVLEIHDPEHNNYERDSVMLGGISPYQDFSDSKSSTETPLSYNQLTYNENLQRYFNSLTPYSNEDDNTVNGENNLENILGLKDSRHFVRDNEYPIAQTSGNSGNSGDMTALLIPKVVLDLCESDGLPDGSSGIWSTYEPVWLTEALLSNHNAIMERELVKKHRETRTCSKEERRKSSDNRKKMKEHLVRCNATYQTTYTTAVDTQPHGVKRSMKQVEGEAGSHKYHCTSSRQLRRRHAGNNAPAQQSTVKAPVASSYWPPTSMSNFIPGVGIPQQMPIMSPVAAVPGMFPMYYVPTATATAPQMQPRQDQNLATSNSGQIPALAMQYMVYGQAVIGSPFVYSTINPQVSYPYQQNLVPQSVYHTNTPSPLGLTQSNYEEACKLTPPMKSTKTHAGIWRSKKRTSESTPNTEQGSGDSSICSSINPHNRGTKHVHEAITTRDSKPKPRASNMEENRTDGESSYSSFYSSFFKTDSAEDSGDTKKVNIGDKQMNPEQSAYMKYQPTEQFQCNKVPKRKADAPWNEQVCVTSELIYKYQVVTKNMNEVLTVDMQKLTKLEQPSLVDEQLGQLYLDLQLQGVASRLTLEEGITSSGSSGEESATKATKVPRRKREHSKMELIYEENAPLPSPPEDEVSPLICMTP